MSEGLSIFIGQLFAFAVIVAVIVKYVVPPVKKLMQTQQDEVREQMAESDKAQTRLAEAERSLEQAISEAQVEAARIREDARGDADRIAEQLREQADAEVARIKAHGGEQIDLHRRQLVRSLQSELATAALAQAEKNVNEKLAQPGERAASIDRFIDELERMAEGSLVGTEGRS
ncbi:F0F1 ATP synthase subunit B [Smaragdicoccus niigatensis]|nr:F0F1 ATP synthase subunit B [Smaragdicoccus niigatensis]